MKRVKTVRILHVGVGNVGRALVSQVITGRRSVEKSLGIRLMYCGEYTSTRGQFLARGLTDAQVLGFPEGAAAIDPMAALPHLELPFVVVDTTSSDETAPLLDAALKWGGSVVLANKRPLAGSSETYTELMTGSGGRIFCEATVGAGLPVVEMLRDMVLTGDAVESVTGVLSGTLGFILSQVEAGSTFSEAVKKAKDQGLTEPDPRDDLSGADVARKVVIVARLAGWNVEIGDIQVDSLYPADMADLTVDEFMGQLPALDRQMADRAKAAKASGKVLRFLAQVNEGSCQVGVREVESSSDLGSLKGPDNMIVIASRRYHDNPMVIKGPGAGVQVTAAAVFGDILRAARG